MNDFWSSGNSSVIIIRSKTFDSLYNRFTFKRIMKKNALIAIAVMAIITVAGVLLQSMHRAEATNRLIDTSTGEVTEQIAKNTVEPLDFRKAPLAISSGNIYVAWWTNDTGNNNNEVMFRASTDGGQSFGDKINLSNTTDSDSTRTEINSDADSVVVTWWETNQTDDTPVMRISTDNGVTFGPILMLGTNGTISSGTQ
jgi:hypothetical protein